MDRDYILERMKLYAAEIGTPKIGQRAFAKASGIRESDWRGKYWPNWSAATTEAGLSSADWNSAYNKEYLAEKLVSLMRELGKFPTWAEINMKFHSDRSFPAPNTFRLRLGAKADLAEFLKTHCDEQGGMEDIVQLCTPHLDTAPKHSDDVVQDIASTGYVYLLKSGKFYKIGNTNNPDRRQYEIGLQLPESIHHVHSIETDDPSGIEAYWHNRFREKRQKGEWFDLDANDIRVFRRRKFM